MSEITIRALMQIDNLQPKFAAYNGATVQGSIPLSGDTVLIGELAPGNGVFGLIDKALKAKKQDKVAIPVIMACSIVVRNKLLDEHPILLRDVLRSGVQFTTICTPAYQGLKGMADIDRGVTNSNKARYYSRLRLFGDDDLLEIAMTGKIPA